LTTKSLSDQDLIELLDLIKGSDSVELKLTVPDSDISSTVRTLGLDPLEAQIRQVVFFDTPDLALNRNGIVVRARRTQGGAGDTVVKLRPVRPDQLSEELRSNPLFGVEVDAMPGGFVCSGSMKGKTTAAKVREVLDGSLNIADLLSKDQKKFYKTHAPSDLKLRDLGILGPITLLKGRWEPVGFGERMVAEYWMYPDGSRILELSTKCVPREAFDFAAKTRAFLSQKGIDLTGEQQTKTRTALEYFASIGAKS
jgi:hypothetical protein